MSMIRVVCYGLGSIGLQIARIVARRTDMQIVGAVDIDPSKIGVRLSTFIQERRHSDPIIVSNAQALLSKRAADIVVLATTSSLKVAAIQIAEIVGAGIPVISTCEELAYPCANNSYLFAELNRLATQRGA